MKILMMVEGFGARLYGVERAVEHISLNMMAQGAEVHIATMVVDGSIDHRLIRHVSTLRYWQGPGHLRFHPLQQAQLRSLIRRVGPDIVHCHGCLSLAQRSAIRAARRLGRAAVLVSPHGMLEPWMWTQKGKAYDRVKRLYWRALMEPVLKQADYVHAITQQESTTLQAEFPGMPQVLIPNAIDLHAYDDRQVEPDAERYLLFLGRLHPVKGVDLLIEAFARADVADFRLVIAGPEVDTGYARHLQAMIASLGLSARVMLVGPVYGDAKRTLLKKAWCAVVPSYSEVMAMVNLESAASFTPSITTTTTGLNDWDQGGGLLIAPRVHALVAALEEGCRWPLPERMRRGRLARHFISQVYSAEVVGRQWAHAYRRVAGSPRQAHA